MYSDARPSVNTGASCKLNDGVSRGNIRAGYRGADVTRLSILTAKRVRFLTFEMRQLRLRIVSRPNPLRQCHLDNIKFQLKTMAC